MPRRTRKQFITRAERREQYLREHALRFLIFELRQEWRNRKRP